MKHCAVSCYDSSHRDSCNKHSEPMACHCLPLLADVLKLEIFPHKTKPFFFFSFAKFSCSYPPIQIFQHKAKYTHNVTWLVGTFCKHLFFCNKANVFFKKKKVHHHCLNSFSLFKQAGVKGTLGRLVGVFEVTFEPSSSVFISHSMLMREKLTFFFFFFFAPPEPRAETQNLRLCSYRHWGTGGLGGLGQHR